MDLELCTLGRLVFCYSFQGSETSPRRCIFQSDHPLGICIAGYNKGLVIQIGFVSDQFEFAKQHWQKQASKTPEAPYPLHPPQLQDMASTALLPCPDKAH